jgi:hypothetical protein
MRPTLLALAASSSLLASPAAAQLANRAISVESGLSAPLQGGGGAGGTLALCAAAWLDGGRGGDLEAVARVAIGSAPGTGGRVAAEALSATVGLRLSLGAAPVRPQVFADLGWAGIGGAGADRLAFGLGGGLEWFAAPDLSLAARGALRGAGAARAAEGVLAVAAYF